MLTSKRYGYERAALVTLFKTGEEYRLERNMEELALLSRTAGIKYFEQYKQKKDRPDPAFYIGRGKLEEIKADIDIYNFDLIIFNEELSPVQIRNIESYLGIQVIDRTGLVLDIFAGRARSKEGKLQVELAQLQYYLTRLTGYGISLSRLGGGIGTRGPGETKLETNRRHIRQRITELKKLIQTVKKHRNVHRQHRKKEGYRTVSLVGYTNTGKSSLLNALAGDSVLTGDMLFATLDPTVRKIYLETGEAVLLSDTVGFIQELPTQLLNAFKATLEEINEADLIIHLVDISNPDYLKQMDTVENILGDLLIGSPKKVLVFNKLDQIDENQVNLSKLERDFPGSVFISIKTSFGLDKLKDRISSLLSNFSQRASFAVPYQEMAFINKLYQNAKVLKVSYTEEDIRIEAETDNVFLKKNSQFLVANSNK